MTVVRRCLPLPTVRIFPHPTPTSSLILSPCSHFAQIALSHLHTCFPIFMDLAAWEVGRGLEGSLFLNIMVTILAPYPMLGPPMGQNEGLGRIFLPSGSPRGSQGLLGSVGDIAGKKQSRCGRGGSCHIFRAPRSYWLGDPGVVREVGGLL